VNPCHQLSHCKGFDQIVISALCQGVHPVGECVLRGQHQHRRSAGAAYDLEQFEAIAAWQHDVQDH
jgi:hypothetical protein